MWNSTSNDEMVRRVNRVLKEWEEWSSQTTGPRLASFDEVTDKVELE
jgi:hypothetical protein